MGSPFEHTGVWKIAKLWVAVLLIGFCCVCCSRYHSDEYYTFYSYLQPPITHCQFPNNGVEGNYFVCIYVDARHLDYSDNKAFLQSIAKHPSDRSKTRDVGHSWIYMQGVMDGECVFVEGGHTGETGMSQAKYFDGIMNYHDFGYANPNPHHTDEVVYEPNPVKYLWEEQNDGYFEWGPGNHRPTFGVKIRLTEEQFQRILCFIRNYNYRRYALTGNQCSTFVAQIASIAGLDLDCETTIIIDPLLDVHGERVRLWCDPVYSMLTIATPDTIERSLVKAVREGKAECVYSRYP